MIARLLLALALTLPAVLHAAGADCPPPPQPPAPEQVQQAMRDAKDRGFLWRIDKGGRTSWLYGTIHAARLEWMFPGPQTSRALRASDTLALELDALDPEVQRRMAQGLKRPGAPLPDALAQRLAGQLRAACVEPALVEGQAPEMQVAALSVLAARRDGLEPAFAIDLYLAGFGHGAGKPVVSLETPELQLAALRAGSAEETAAFVDAGLAELESGKARPMLLRIANVWAESDLGQLMRYEAWCECLETLAERIAMKRLLDDRNPALAARIDALHAGGKRVFAAVGSLHMVGPAGLPALLARRGYRVERVPFSP